MSDIPTPSPENLTMGVMANESNVQAKDPVRVETEAPKEDVNEVIAKADDRRTRGEAVDKIPTTPETQSIDEDRERVLKAIQASAELTKLKQLPAVSTENPFLDKDKAQAQQSERDQKISELQAVVDAASIEMVLHVASDNFLELTKLRTAMGQGPLGDSNFDQELTKLRPAVELGVLSSSRQYFDRTADNSEFGKYAQQLGISQSEITKEGTEWYTKERDAAIKRLEEVNTRIAELQNEAIEDQSIFGTPSIFKKEDPRDSEFKRLLSEKKGLVLRLKI